MNIRKQGFRSAALALVLVAATGANAAWSINPPFGPAGNGNIVLAQAGDTERFARLEDAVRRLTGQVEELNHQLRLLQEQLRLVHEDVDFRLTALEGGGGGTGLSQSPPALPQETFPQDQVPLSDAMGTVPADPLDPNAELGAAPRPLGQLTIDAPPPPEAQPLDLSTLAGGSVMDDLQAPLQQAPQQEVALAAPTGNPQADYDQAYAMIRSGRYDLAEGAFRQFLGAYPGSELAPEAQYWLGESHFARGDYARAAEEFRAGYKAYPTSQRGPDTLLKLGLSMAGLGYRDEACQMYAATLKQYPDMSNALLQRVRNEQASAAC
jgi:tol-pal system protein YbgF